MVRSVSPFPLTRPRGSVRELLHCQTILMVFTLLLLRAVAAGASLPAPAVDEPRYVVREAMLAVRGDSVAAVRARWMARLQRDSADRAAALGLATLARLTYDFVDAEHRYRRLFVSDATRADGYDAYARIGLGLAIESQWMGAEEAVVLYEQSLASARRAGDRAAEGTAHLRLGEALGRRGRRREALAHLDSAMQVLPTSAGDARAALRCRRAQVLLVSAGPGSADSLRAARDFASAVDDDEAYAQCLSATSLDYVMRGKADSVAITYAARIAHRRRMHDRSGLSLSLLSYADYLQTHGELGTSARMLREALAEAQASQNHYAEATIAHQLGITALALNDVASAAAYVKRAARAFEVARDTSSQMLALSSLADVSLASGDLDGARRQLVAILGYWRGQQDWEHLVDLDDQLVRIEIRAGDLAAAALALDSAASAARKTQSPVALANVAYHRAELAVARGDLQAAERELARYLAAADTSAHLARYDGRVHLAQVQARRGDLARAERELAAAGVELDAWRSTLADPEIRTLAFQAGAFETNDLNARIAEVIAKLARGGRGAAAFELAEGRRARELATHLARTRALAQTPAAPRDSTPRDALGGARALTLAEISAAIPDDRTALLEYVSGTVGVPTTLFVVTRAAGTSVLASTYVLTPSDSLVPDVARLVGLLEAGDDPRALERSLGATLLDSAVRALASSITRLVIVPDGALHRVPWDALRLPNGRYAAARFAIGVAPSATVAATLWRTPRTPTARVRLLAFGDPAFSAATPPASEGESYRGAFDATGGLARLPESAREARLVARFADDAEVRLGKNATAAYLERASLTPYEVLHFATHAVVDDRIATRTALALAPGSGDDDGFVSPAQLAALRLNSPLVVLSACRSAGGVVVGGEGVQGLTAPLLAAGARVVVATSWRISDRGTVPLVDAFYAAMARGLPVGDALRAAKLEAIRRGAPPRDWAAFTAVGDPLAIIPLHEPRRSPYWMAVLLLALVVAGVGTIGIVRVRRRYARQ